MRRRVFSQWAGVEALDGDQAFIKDNVAVFEERRDLAVSILNQASFRLD